MDNKFFPDHHTSCTHHHLDINCRTTAAYIFEPIHFSRLNPVGKIMKTAIFSSCLQAAVVQITTGKMIHFSFINPA